MAESALHRIFRWTFCLLVCLLFISGRAEAGSTWMHTYGDTGSDMAYSLARTADGGYVIAGTTWSMTGSNRWDAWIVRLSYSGRIVWQRSYGGKGDDQFNDIKQTADGGYVATGIFGTAELWVVKLDADGNVQWQESFGDTDVDKGGSVQQTSDGGYIVAGMLTVPFDVSLTRPAWIGRDLWLLKLDGNGAVQWQKAYGANVDRSMFHSGAAYQVVETSDGGYLAASRATLKGGTAYSESGTALIKVDGNGTLQWQKWYRDTGYYGHAGILVGLQDGGYVLGAVYSGSLWLTKVDNAGTAEWQRYYKDTPQTYGTGALAATATQDGGFVASGQFGSDAWVVKLDGAGNIQWQKQVAGNGTDRATGVQQSSDGGYVAAGWTNSFGAGNYDAWVLKLDAAGNALSCATGLAVRDTFAAPIDSNIGSDLLVTEIAPAVSLRVTSATDNPTTAVSGVSCATVAPVIAAAPASLDFGALEIPGTAARTVTVENSGTAALTVSSVSVEGADAGSFIQTNTCSVVSMGSSCLVTVTFSATALGSKAAVLTIASDDPDNPAIAVSLSGAGADTVPPATMMQLNGSEGVNSWYRSDVTVKLDASDAGAGVREIHYAVDGIETPAPGNAAVFTISAEGSYRLIYFAVDGAGNYEAVQSLTVNIDKTPPVVTAVTTPVANANGWNNTDSTVTFVCADATSGMASCTEPITVSAEGANQVITGTAVDNAGNSASTSVTLNIDKTSPSVNVTATPNILWPPNHKMVNVMVGGSAADGGSDVVSAVITVTDEYGIYNMTVPGFGSTILLEASRNGKDKDGRLYTITAVVTDKAGNQSTATTTVLVPHDRGDRDQQGDDGP